MTWLPTGLIRSIIFLSVMALLSPTLAAAADNSIGGGDPFLSAPWWESDPGDLFFADPGAGDYNPYLLMLGPLAFDPMEWDNIEGILPPASNGDLWLIQIRSPEYIDDLRSLDDDRYRIMDAASPLTFIVRAAGSNSIMALEDEAWIRSVIPYHPLMKISSSLYRLANARDGSASGMLSIGIYDLSRSGEVEEIMEMCLDRPEILVPDSTISGSFSHGDVLSIASLPGVSHVSLDSIEEPDNDIAADIIDVMEVWNTMGLNGSGQIVAVTDSGLDTGNNVTMHQDVSGRIRSAYAYGRTGNWSDPDIHVWTSSGWSYKGGHGTHVVGSVLGDGSASNGNYSGMAPEAELVMQSTMASTGSYSIPAYTRLFDDAYNSGARIHTNSWSSRSSYGNYTSKSWTIDNYMWSHRNLTTLFSAGNNGNLGPYHVSTQASSKNVIAVGASESYRPSLSSWANNISEIASFSSQGYTWGDNRIKPDVVAPGTYILSMRNSQLTDFWNHYWGSNSTYVGVNSKYAYYGGTSMSTPIVAGMSALIRQYYTDLEEHEDPSSALIKATVINGARPLNGNWNSIPNRYEGWGRVNLSNSLGSEDSNAGTMKYIDNSTGVKNGKTHSSMISVSSGSSDLIATLVWTDYPGSNTSSIKLVNDLDLTITTPDGTVYHGNDLTSPFNSSRDRVNNVERIRISSPVSGLYTLNITGYSVSYGPQPYAVVMTGNITESVAKMDWTRGIVNADGGSVELRLSDSNLTGNGWHLIKVNTTSDPTGEMLNLTEIVQDSIYSGIFTGTVTLTMGTPGPGEVMSASDGELKAYYLESYPHRTLISTTLVLVPPAVVEVKHDAAEVNLTYQDRVVVVINGTSGYTARFSVVNISVLQNISALDDGQGFDAVSGDGIYTGTFTVPNYINGTYVVRGSIKRPGIPEVTLNSTTPLKINTNIPRMPFNVSVEPLPMGNILKATWEDPGDPNLMNFKVYRANETYPGSGEPSVFSMIHQTPDARTYYTDRDLIDGSTYFYSLSSFNVLGFESRRTAPAYGIPHDSTSPWIKIRSPEIDSTIRGVVEINLSFEEDARWISLRAAVDNDEDTIPDNGWIEILNVTDPTESVFWNTLDLPYGISDGDVVILRALGADESGNQNGSGQITGIRIDNTMPEILTIDSPLVQALSISSYRLSGRSEPDSRITVSRNGVPMWMYQCDRTGLFQFHLGLEYGVNLFEVSSFDYIGNGPLIFDEILYIVYDPDDPVAVIPDLDLATSRPVVLDGSLSHDEGPDSDLSGIAFYSWEVEFGGEINEYDGEEISLDITEPGPISIGLTVHDQAGNTGSEYVEVRIVDDIPPELSDMEDIEVDEDADFTLTPPDIIDNDPDIMANGVFFWNISGPEVYSVYSRNATFMLSTPGVYAGSLQIFDTGGNVDIGTFDITVADISPPSARAGPDLIVIRYDTVRLDGSSSLDNDPSHPSGFNFTWRITGLDHVIYGEAVEFVPDTIGVYEIELTVTDRAGNTGRDSVHMRVVSDGEPPELEYSLPGNGWTNVTPTGEIILVFNEPLDGSTVQDGIRLIEEGGSRIGFNIKMEGSTRVRMKPLSSLKPGRSYSVSLGSEIRDMTGTSHEASTFSFIVRPEIGIESAGSDGNSDDELVLTSLPGNITITFDNPISGSSVVSMFDGEGHAVPIDYYVEERILVITIPGDTGNGIYSIDLSGVVGKDGGPMTDEARLEVTISVAEEGDPGSGSGGSGGTLMIILLVVIPLILIIIAVAVVMVIRSRRGEGSSEPDPDAGAGAVTPYDPSPNSPGEYGTPPGKQ